MNHDHAKHDKPAAVLASHQNDARECDLSSAAVTGQRDKPGSPASLLRKPDMIAQLQRAIGNRAVQRMVQNTRSIQRDLDVTSETKPTPAAKVKQLTGATNMKKDLALPGGRVEDTERPIEAKATVTDDTLRDGVREKTSILSAVTGMARDEQKVMKGVATNKYFDAGHLIADELIAGDPTVGDDGSFIYENLAPQQSTFNQVSYRVFENKVRRWATWGNTVEVTTTLTYDGDYSVTNQELVDNGVVKKQIAATNLANSTTIPRRVPKTWKIHAKIRKYKRGKKKSITAAQKRSTYQGSANYADNLPNSEIPAGTGHRFNLSKEVLSGRKGNTFTKPTDDDTINKRKDPKKKKLRVDKEKEMVGKQWTPTNSPSLEEITSIIQAAYPKLGLEAIAHLVNEGKLMIDISKVDDLLDVKEPTFEQIVKKYATEAPSPDAEPTNLDEVDTYCESLKKWLRDEKKELKDERDTQKGLLATTQDPVKRAAIGSVYLEALDGIAIIDKSYALVQEMHTACLREQMNRYRNLAVPQANQGQKRPNSVPVAAQDATLLKKFKA